MRVLIQPPTVYGGSLGDEALIRGAVAVCPGAEVVLPADRAHEWVLPGVHTRLDTEIELSDYEHVVCIGADCIDGYYGTGPLSLIERYAWKVPTSVVSFSMRVTPDQAAVKRLKLLVDVGVRFSTRGTVSAHIFEETVGSPVTAASDLAFLAPNGVKASPAVPTPYIVACVSRRDEGLRTIAAVIRGLNRSYHVVILSHDRRDHGDLISALTLADAIRDVPHTVIEPASSTEARGWLAGAELVITQRLHAAIGAFAEGVPAVALNHHDKMLDTFMDLDVSSLVAEHPFELPHVVSQAMRDRAALRTVIAHGLPKMRARARANVEGVC